MEVETQAEIDLRYTDVLAHKGILQAWRLRHGAEHKTIRAFETHKGILQAWRLRR